MLRFLSIKSLAVIEAAEVEFGPGLNVLTGETGAGKSILVEAVGLLLGGRASGDLVRTGEEVATVEAIFESGGEEIIVRREITAHGRSRAFINGSLATAAGLKELAARLVELHGQHEHQTLLDPSTHLTVVDAYGALDSLLAPVAAAFTAMHEVEAERARVRRAAADRQSRQELVEFQLAELDRAELKSTDTGEDVELLALKQVLSSAERVERLCTESYAALYERDDAILAGLGGVWRRVAELAALDPRFQPYLEARDGIKSQLEDLALFLRRYADGIEASPERLRQIEDRLALLERLKRKHGPTLADAIIRRDGLRRELQDLRQSDERLAELDRAHSAARDVYIREAGTLSAARRKTATTLSAALVAALAELAMGEARFEVRFDEGQMPETSWGPTGFDAAEFFLSANPGEDLRPLARIVSGGELSRVMLAIKTLAGRGAGGLIFDEVDAGIGGRVADVVGRKLRALGSSFQVLCITHLPQIASCADVHFQIEKRVEGGRTHTAVRRLDDEGRVDELGRMLGGASVTDALRASAREMLAERRRHAPGGASALAPGDELKAKGESERAKAKPSRKAR